MTPTTCRESCLSLAAPKLVLASHGIHQTLSSSIPTYQHPVITIYAKFSNSLKRPQICIVELIAKNWLELSAGGKARPSMGRKFLDKIYNVEPAFKAINKRVHVPNLGQGASGQGQDLALFKVRCVIFYVMRVCDVYVSVRLLFVFLCNGPKCVFQCVCACVCFCVSVRWQPSRICVVR